jgi:ABC-2 type transport system ATP-binding protein
MDEYGLRGGKDLIRVVDFHKAYDRTMAVQGLSFEVAGGQVLGLVGPNGAGKTSTMRAIAGILPASRGRLEIDRYSLEDAPLEAKSRLGYIPDDPQLFDDLTVAEHLAFFASAYNVTNAACKAQRLLQQFQLDEKLHATARDLSRGMRQKLAICCAYLHDPQAILFDEPLTGLDPHGIRTLKESILSRAGAGAAVIVSSHLLAMVEDICTHVLILERGEQRFLGPLFELQSRFAQGESATSLEEIYFRATQAVVNQSISAGAPSCPTA